jgi:hypothetical protein
MKREIDIEVDSKPIKKMTLLDLMRDLDETEISSNEQPMVSTDPVVDEMLEKIRERRRKHAAR